MSNHELHWIANYIWGGCATHNLAASTATSSCRQPVLRRLGAVLEDSKQAVLDMKAVLDEHGVVEQKSALRQVARQAFYNTSPFTLRPLRARASRPG